jgi:rod shape-determining protein MreD
VQAGDLLHTSGLDGVYPPGCRWPRCAVERRAESGFARILLAPVARADGVRHVLVLEPLGLQLPPRPAARPPAAAGAAAAACRPARAPWPPRGPHHDHAARLRPAAAAGQPALHRLHAAAGAGLNLLPLGRTRRMPDLLAVVLVFWNVHQPRRVGVGVAFLFGLLMDVHEGALLGQHALAYTLLSYGAIAMHRRLLWFGWIEQALQMLPLFFAAHAGVAGWCACRRRHVPGLVAAAGAGVRGAAVAAGHVAAAGAAAPRARSGQNRPL